MDITINKYHANNYRRLFLSPYVETYYDSNNNMATFFQYLFEKKLSLIIENSVYNNMIVLLNRGIDENCFNQFLNDHNMPAQFIIDNMLARCIIE